MRKDNSNYTRINYVTTGVDIAINDLVYWKLVFDADQSIGNRITLYYYNQTSSQSGIWHENQTVGTPAAPILSDSDILYLGTYYNSTEVADAIIDNFKVTNCV